METDRREFLEDLLEARSPSGYETEGQRIWVSYVREFADDVWTDEYGNAVAVHEGDPEVEFAVGGDRKSVV